MTDHDADPQHAPLDPSRYRAALALVRALIPPGEKVVGGNLRTAAMTEALFAEMSPAGGTVFRQLVAALDWAAALRTGRRFHKLDPDAQERLIRCWELSPLWRWPLFALGGAVKTAHFDHEEVHRPYCAEFVKGGPPEPARWLEQVESGDDWEDAEPLECDVVVVGSGAGGAIVGRELAEQGHAVVFLEEGSLYRRDAFKGSAITAHQTFYRGQGKIAFWGNTMVPILMGRLVGGSTAINTGTSFRTPPWILDEWCERIGTDELSPEHMKRHFDYIERQIQVEPADPKYIGPIGDIVKRGCERLGWSHFRVPRNAPDCDAQGTCDFGCPSAARRSMDVAILPKAFARGAMLFTETRATRVLVESGRAVGVEAESVNKGRKITVRARAVLLAGGAIPTPMLLLAQGLCNRSGQVGGNLTIHPGSAVVALMDDPVDPHKHIPQGVGIDQFHRQGFLLLAAQASLNIGALMLPFYGRRFTEVYDQYAHLSGMGVLVRDATQNGRVRVGIGGEPMITYWLQRRDIDLMHRGACRIAEMYFAAGARRVFPVGHRMPVLERPADLDAFRKRRIGPSDYIWTAFHPLGTIRMGRDPLTSVINTNHETHDVRGLYVVDGGAVPGPTAVNPQLTIMAMAHRAAEKIGERLEE